MTLDQFPIFECTSGESSYRKRNAYFPLAEIRISASECLLSASGIVLSASGIVLSASGIVLCASGEDASTCGKRYEKVHFSASILRPRFCLITGLQLLY